MTNHFLHVSLFHRSEWFSFRVVQSRNVRNVVKGRTCALGIPDRFLGILREVKNTVARITV